MDVNFLDAARAIIEPVATVLGSLYAVWRFSIKLKRKRQHEIEKAIEDAKESASIVNLEMDNKIKALAAKIETLKVNIDQNFDHARELHDNEIKSLGEKIEALRQQLSDQHGSLVQLLGKLIDKN
jgi:hypothetical protein